MPAAKNVSGKQALIQALNRLGGGPAPAKEIIEAALKLATGLKGKTPAATLSAMLATENAKAEGMFIRTAPGVYKLRAAKATPKPRLQQKTTKPAAKKTGEKAEASS